jgi:hypothetical protein
LTWKQELNPVKVSDYEPNNILYRKPVEVIENVYTAVGATQPGTYVFPSQKTLFIILHIRITQLH